MAKASKRIFSSLGAVFVAALVAVVGTVQHQTQLGPGTPLGLIFGLSLVFMAAAFIRDRSRSKWPALSYAMALAMTVFLIGQNLSDDILIPGNDLGLLWSYGSIGIAMLVALWPKLKIKS